MQSVSASDDAVAFITETRSSTRTFQLATVNGSVHKKGSLPDIPNPLTNAPIIDTLLAPPGLIAGIALVVSFMEPEQWGPLPASTGMWMLVVLHAAVGAMGTLFLIRSRVPSTRLQYQWMAFGAIAGVGTWLAVIAVYPRAVIERCASCERRRRVDRERCEHCGVEWELPDSEGISLIGPRYRDSLTPEHASI
jgi:hypothetical protein